MARRVFGLKRKLTRVSTTRKLQSLRSLPRRPRELILLHRQTLTEHIPQEHHNESARPSLLSFPIAYLSGTSSLAPDCEETEPGLSLEFGAADVPAEDSRARTALARTAVSASGFILT